MLAKRLSWVVWPDHSGAPHDMFTASTPWATAVSTAASMSVMLAEFASTITIEQFGQMAEIICTSRVASAAPSTSVCAGRVFAPSWLTIREQPLAVVHGGSPNADR